MAKTKTVKPRKGRTAANIPVVYDDETAENKGEIRDLTLRSVLALPSLQMRKKLLDENYVEYLVDVTNANSLTWVFPPVRVVEAEMDSFSSESDSGEPADHLCYFLYDGFHRLEAAKRLGLESIPAEIIRGETTEYIDAWNCARWHSCFADLDTKDPIPLGRTIEDKRKAAKNVIMINEGYGPGEKLSDREIARRLRVSHTFISNLRNAPEKTRETIADETELDKIIKRPPKVNIAFEFNSDQQLSADKMGVLTIWSISDIYKNRVQPLTGETTAVIDVIKSFRDAISREIERIEEMKATTYHTIGDDESIQDEE